ncbi:4-hydroxy-3-methylbut-2-enyl diphosphate reductase [Malacoplasma penetrans]|uniref:4-hydroxy-3-methylbut-2-enyl diphosphate reductase n=1 Tax=Malacoplasma penetrans (strain HF-2) TaxID=272633 RepID=ISPH_MALP2|nr:4-hydroxy-3-methylbut-2-enyl diphosphate reductase [Malacoplasma penetrans]Q8EWR9.1 RecName: Full=4-hydroxy-3-methylbut-2-enyl diphosphate reductase; Short=HMBPP reductase [Malacoplasma penetrans HF-2]RXY97012.1 4-hydroxy-3-methylbut-2-enyl diphosphate reductase [Malacoplasma penetrans]BAC43925.1 lytB protein [Malacoplasma penetrans HF-2]
MKIIKITPRGFCKGVVDAYATCKKIAKLYPNHEKYLIGWLVHNKEIIKELEELGIQTKDDKNHSRSEIIDSIEIKDKNNPPIVIFSAHGTDQKTIDKAREKGLVVFDTTCIYVTKTHDLIKEKIEQGYQIFYIGVNNHPETISTLSIDKSIILIETVNDIENIRTESEKPIFVTNQTTISIYEFEEITETLKSKYKNIEFKNDICNAAKDRQDAVINMPSEVDLLLVVGDIKSNNSKKLVEIGIKKQIESHLIWNTKNIKDEWFINKKCLAITSGCSTPTWLANYVIIFLEKKLGTAND